MERRILDTDILIDHLRGYLPAEGYIEQFEFGFFRGYITIITRNTKHYKEIKGVDIEIPYP
ncbi:MAG: hypothetical protein AB1630_06180 [bacterium]